MEESLDFQASDILYGNSLSREAWLHTNALNTGRLLSNQELRQKLPFINWGSPEQLAAMFADDLKALIGSDQLLEIHAIPHRDYFSYKAFGLRPAGFSAAETRVLFFPYGLTLDEVRDPTSKQLKHGDERRSWMEALKELASLWRL